LSRTVRHFLQAVEICAVSFPVSESRAGYTSVFREVLPERVY
jgi:hypothetical protein